MKHLAWLIILLSVLPFTACRNRCDRIEGPRERHQIPVEGIDAFTLYTPANVSLVAGDTLNNYFEIIAQPEVYNALITNIEQGTYSVDMQSCFKGQEVTLINGKISGLKEVYMQAAGEIVSAEIIEEDSMYLKSDGLGDIDMTINTLFVNTRIYSSGNITVGGRTTKLHAQASGSGELNAYNLFADSVVINNFGTGIMEIYADQYLEVNFDSSTVVKYRGHPTKIVINGEGELVDSNF